MRQPALFLKPGKIAGVLRVKMTKEITEVAQEKEAEAPVPAPETARAMGKAGDGGNLSPKFFGIMQVFAAMARWKKSNSNISIPLQPDHYWYTPAVQKRWKLKKWEMAWWKWSLSLKGKKISLKGEFI